MKKLKGFTIIELLIVMAVIAILVGIAVPSFRAIQTQAWKAKAQGDTKVLKIALESYYIGHGDFPAETPSTKYQTDLLAESPSMLESNLYDPFGDNPTAIYKYDLSSNGKYYVVYSEGPGSNGVATINNDGDISITAGDPVWASNGRLP